MPVAFSAAGSVPRDIAYRHPHREPRGLLGVPSHASCALAEVSADSRVTPQYRNPWRCLIGRSHRY